MCRAYAVYLREDVGGASGHGNHEGMQGSVKLSHAYTGPLTVQGTDLRTINR